ncbi:MAG TPA: RidA family protein [Terriglobales bacterium]|nr:RidA family protein [Terriglobales bacterium]
MRRLVLFLLLLAATAACAGDAKPHQYLNVPQHIDGVPYSDAVLAGDTLYLAGRLGIDTKTRKVPADLDEEARVLLDSVKAALAPAGMTTDDLVMVTIYCPDLSLFERFNAVYKTYFPNGHYPARAFVGSGPLLFGAHFEIVAVAVRQHPAKPAGKSK